MKLDEDTIILAHGSGGKLSHRLIEEILEPAFDNPYLRKLDDSAELSLNGRVAFTTDSYVVDPIFFPGGDIGKLAVCGTVNDLSMVGAEPKFLSLALIIEEGLKIVDLKVILESIKRSADEAGVMIVTGDTKVVGKKGADKIFVNTAGVGVIPEGLEISGSNARVGDKIIISGTIGDHGTAILSSREGIEFETELESDCAPLNGLVADMLAVTKEIRSMRDPTRGGVASTLNEFAGASKVGIKIFEETLPIKEQVRGACEMLGFDPLILANEGKLIAVAASDAADKLVEVMRKHPYGKDAVVIGEVLDEPIGKVFLETGFGTKRIVDMLVGEQLPRIC